MSTDKASWDIYGCHVAYYRIGFMLLSGSGKNIFDTDTVYNGYMEVIEAIKREPCCSNSEVNMIIDQLKQSLSVLLS